MSLGSLKAYQVLAILSNPTFTTYQRLTRDNLMDLYELSPNAYQVLAQVILRDFKLTRNIKTING